MKTDADDMVDHEDDGMVCTVDGGDDGNEGRLK